MSYPCPLSYAAADEARALLGPIDQPDDFFRQRVGVRLRHNHRVVPVGEDVDQTIGVGRDDRFAGRQGFERRQRRAFPERRKYGQIECRERASGVALEAGEDEPIAEAEACRLRLEIRSQRSLSHQHEANTRPRATTRAAASTRYEFPFESCSRVIVPATNSSARRPSSARAAAISSGLRGRPNSSTGAPR